MHGIGLLHKWLVNTCPAIHLARIGAVVKVVEGLLGGGKLALTHLGRHLNTHAFAKHNIKCVDRLLGNRHLHHERLDVYRAVAQWVVGTTLRPVILVDWSDCQGGPRYVMLTAAVPLGGRALTLYEEVHPLASYNSPRTHRRFLRRLKQVLPEGCCPILVTDAGFRGPWFREVENLGWDWVGRVRNQVKYCLEGTETWHPTAGLYRIATPRARHLGRARLAKRRSYACELYLVRKHRRGPGRPRKVRGRRHHRSLHRDPWLLATSLSHRRGSAREVVRLYSLRMQIEERYRDLKGGRWGLGLEYARSRSARRLEVLLLISTLATLVYWLAGLVAKAKGWMRHFQANTERREPVLSVFFLGLQSWRSHRLRPTRAELIEAARMLPTLVPTGATYV